ncbi:MAG: hypothetical protein IPO77_21920 [Acidobacteria bacterium]|nr:hypothetical protein [Acidobacteriota bacterium]
MRTSPTLNTTRRRSLVMTGMIIALVGLLIAFGQNNSSAASQPKAVPDEPGPGHQQGNHEFIFIQFPGRESAFRVGWDVHIERIG